MMPPTALGPEEVITVLNIDGDNLGTELALGGGGLAFRSVSANDRDASPGRLASFLSAQRVSPVLPTTVRSCASDKEPFFERLVGLYMGFPRDRFGCSIEAITEENRYGQYIHQSYEIELPDGRVIHRENYWSAVALAAVYQAIGDLDLQVEDSSLIPVRVAVMGRPAMAAYLVGVHGLSKEEAAERLDVQLSSITEYLREFRREVRNS